VTATAVSRGVARATIWARLSPLESRSFDDLRDLEDSKEDLQVDGVDATLCVWREGQEDGSVWVIGQLATPQRPFLLVFSSGQLFAEGFEIRPDGSRRALEERELDYFT